jgi:hypothetical protein
MIAPARRGSPSSEALKCPRAPARDRSKASCLLSSPRAEHHEGMSAGLRRRGHGLLVVVIAALALSATTVLLAKVFNESDSPGSSWIRAGSMSEVQRQGVIYVPEARAFVVASPSMNPLALYARSPHLGEAVRYCPVFRVVRGTGPRIDVRRTRTVRTRTGASWTGSIRRSSHRWQRLGGHFECDPRTSPWVEGPSSLGSVLSNSVTGSLQTSSLPERTVAFAWKSGPSERSIRPGWSPASQLHSVSRATAAVKARVQTSQGSFSFSSVMKMIPHPG